jgi:hypothetical protein
MRIFIALLVVSFMVVLSSCRNDFEFEDYQGNLMFSKETVYLDTVFSNIGSSTYRLKVYNNSDTDLVIPTLKLGKGVSSKFRLMVDGLTGEDNNGDKIGDGKIFYNVELLARDFMFVFIEVTSSILDANPTDFLYTDEIEFYAKNNQVLQKVNLVTLVQDAVFIYPERTGSPNNFTYENVNLGLNSNNQTPIKIEGSKLSANDPVNGDELNWTNQKPYVIYGYAVVPNGETLVIKEGARIHFHANSGLLVNKTANLQINGKKDIVNNGVITIKREVTFEGDRLEYSFSETPGQWAAIIFLSETDNNWIKYTTIKNASVGLFMQPFELYQDNPPSLLGNPKILIENSQFYNHSNIGILGRNANITGKNVVINNCGEASLACTFGGNFNFTHSTINNSFNSTKQTALVLNDYRKKSQTTFDTLSLQANFNNCIIYGYNSRNIFLDKKGSSFNFTFDHCLIKFNSQNVVLENPNLYIFTNNTLYKNCSITDNSTTHNPKYKNTNRNQLWPTQDLNLPINPLFATFEDINNQPRDSNVNLGAYQTIP